MWIDSLYVSRGLSSEGLQDALAIRDEVFRGSYSEPFQLPPSSERVLPPLLSSLVDVKLFRSDTTNLSLLKKDLVEEYNSAKDEFDRARAARSLTRLSLIDMDYEGAEYWRKKCEDEGIGECR
ncbi:MAG: hypothetical protein KJO98_01615 [Rhodothermia bacterium]|nr:hypothetical protein [Rhodothermia bacterium]